MRYVCPNCKFKSGRKYSICPNCGESTMVEESEIAPSQSPSEPFVGTGASKPKPVRTYTVSELSHDVGRLSRHPTKISEFDRLLMGGLVDGQVVLIGAAPGFGKSTLCLEVAGRLAEDGMSALYASGEESERQIGQRAERLGISGDNLHIVSAKSTDAIIATAESLGAKVLVVDSLQAMESDGTTGALGGNAQSKAAAYAYTDWAKRTGGMALLVSQFTKGDEVAGSNMIAHVVDTILVGESDSDSRLKFLRSRKNRYGRTDEVAVFVHEDNGLISVTDPSGYLIGDDRSPMAGAAMSVMRDGVRMLPVEVDALVIPSTYSNPQRQFSGMDSSRAKILVAALSKYADESGVIKAGDVFANTINGIRITDPMADLAIIASIASSAAGMEPKYRTAWMGEVSLTGRIRGRSMMQDRVREAMRLGFGRVVIPESASAAVGDLDTGDLIVAYADSVSDIPDLL